jgi:hypothetical protein
MDTVRRSAGRRPKDWTGTTPRPEATVATAEDSRLDADSPPPFGPAPVTRYACDVCGNVEEWIDEESDLTLIRLLAADPRARPMGKHL